MNASGRHERDGGGRRGVRDERDRRNERDENRDDESRDADPSDGRQETPNERYDRNWSELLQELRVFQTGTQILAAFLVTLPFQQRFSELQPFDIGVYCVLVLLAVVVTLLALAPVSLHRMLFRRGAKRDLVNMSNKILIACLIGASLLFTGIVLFIVDFLTAPPTGVIVAAIVFVALATVWIALPLVVRSRLRTED